MGKLVTVYKDFTLNESSAPLNFLFVSGESEVHNEAFGLGAVRVYHKSDNFVNLCQGDRLAFPPGVSNIVLKICKPQVFLVTLGFLGFSGSFNNLIGFWDRVTILV